MKKVLAILTLGLFAAGAYAQAPAAAPESKEPAKVQKSAHKDKTHAQKHTKKAMPDKAAAQ
ncbi:MULTISPECIES: hypothetical protein [Cupriavidus]|jgi:hypothetical protein|uniref:Uncharacterized protein n=2 Tax=Cupriavidus pinatubonensis TaxID=248026 RepID=Q46SM5_CUPPJ|nr:MULTISPECIES: hypothetical protein [Cupriavidus]QYY28446.1 hypothetical protein K2O51_11250 [Cupriavidus pinatubonensis]TPQ36362.1 hypothetical protein C2U69_19115 [Cupriavidus pinatubonensis]CAG9177765.1 hypothetical protein LMG23994_03732 [Cupriavidus pinatubonensis]